MNIQTTLPEISAQVEPENFYSNLELLLCLFFFAGFFQIFRFLKTLLGPFFWRRLDLHKRYGGGWAVVTGGSEGIGEAIAAELAKSGFNLILVSRSLEKLRAAKQMIQKTTPGIQVETYSVDFCELTTEKQYKDAFKSILEKDVSILVNNVGAYNPTPFDKLEFSALRRQMKLNLLPIAVLTRLFSQKFLQRQQRSGLINLSSGAAIAVYKYACDYAATKAFDDFLSRAVQYELRNKVDVLTMRPYFVTSAMTKNLTGFAYSSPQVSAKHAVDALGNADICYGAPFHRLQGAVSSQLNEALVTKSYNQMMDQFAPLFHKKQ